MTKPPSDELTEEMADRLVRGGLELGASMIRDLKSPAVVVGIAVIAAQYALLRLQPEHQVPMIDRWIADWTAIRDKLTRGTTH
jgi:hypothetical protein